MRISTRIKKQCLVCGKEFSVSPASQRRGVYCSTKCAGKGRTQGLTAIKPAAMIKITCQYCGKEFEHPKWQSHYARRYCSQSCSRRARKGKSIHIKRSNETHLRKDILPMQQCSICGFKRAVEIAHIFPKIQGGSFKEENILFLCPNHHRLFDSHKLNEAELAKLNDTARLTYSFFPGRRNWKALQ